MEKHFPSDLVHMRHGENVYKTITHRSERHMNVLSPFKVHRLSTGEVADYQVAILLKLGSPESLSF